MVMDCAVVAEGSSEEPPITVNSPRLVNPAVRRLDEARLAVGHLESNGYAIPAKPDYTGQNAPSPLLKIKAQGRTPRR